LADRDFTGEYLPYADGSFDFVFCFDIIEHVQDLPKGNPKFRERLNQEVTH
jgi:2-polyprenyl-3-methyl-5-hydroxy-6-metoxy-1,4-benzoquinol methylase